MTILCPECEEPVTTEDLVDEVCGLCGYRPTRLPAWNVKGDSLACICPQDSDGTDPSCPEHSR